jgi:hypothetical protein
MQQSQIEDVINELFDVLDEKIAWQPFDGFWLRTVRAAALAFAPLLLARLLTKGRVASA